MLLNYLEAYIATADLEDLKKPLDKLLDVLEELAEKAPPELKDELLELLAAVRDKFGVPDED